MNSQGIDKFKNTEIKLITNKERLIKKVANRDNSPLTQVEELDFENISSSIACRWMHIAGAKFCVMQKNYYTDAHENKENKKDRELRYIHMQ